MATAAAVLSMLRWAKLLLFVSNSSRLVRRVRSPLVVVMPVKPEMVVSLLPSRLLVAVAAPIAGATDRLPLPA